MCQVSTWMFCPWLWLRCCVFLPRFLHLNTSIAPVAIKTPHSAKPSPGYMLVWGRKVHWSRKSPSIAWEGWLSRMRRLGGVLWTSVRVFSRRALSPRGESKPGTTELWMLLSLIVGAQEMKEQGFSYLWFLPNIQGCPALAWACQRALFFRFFWPPSYSGKTTHCHLAAPSFPIILFPDPNFRCLRWVLYNFYFSVF